MLPGIIGWTILGLIIGFIASRTVNLHGDDPNMGILLAGGGAIFGGWMYCMIARQTDSPLSFLSLTFATVGCGLTLLLWHGMRKHSMSRYR